MFIHWAIHVQIIQLIEYNLNLILIFNLINKINSRLFLIALNTDSVIKINKSIRRTINIVHIIRVENRISCIWNNKKISVLIHLILSVINVVVWLGLVLGCSILKWNYESISHMYIVVFNFCLQCDICRFAVCTLDASLHIMLNIWNYLAPNSSWEIKCSLIKFFIGLIR